MKAIRRVLDRFFERDITDKDAAKKHHSRAFHVWGIALLLVAGVTWLIFHEPILSSDLGLLALHCHFEALEELL